MSFWTSNLGEITGDSKQAFSKEFGNIPNGTMALARIESFINDEYNGMKYLHITWELIHGEFKRRKVSQKLKVIDADPRDKEPEKTKFRGLNMLKLIYDMFNIVPQHNNIPTNNDLSIFIGKEAGIQIRETNPNENGKSYNYVSEVHPAKDFKCETGHTVVVRHPVDSALSRYAHTRVPDLDGDLPF